VIVNAFLINSLDIVPRNARIGAKGDSDIANDILHKPGIVVRLHRHVALIDPLQEWINWCRRRSFRDFHEFFDPNNGGYSFRIRGTANLDAYVTSLVVRTVVTDRLAARAEARDWYANPEQEVMNITGGLSDKPAIRVHERRRVTYWRRTLQKIGEPHFNACTLCT
jgi:hypothetical protein